MFNEHDNPFADTIVEDPQSPGVELEQHEDGDIEGTAGDLDVDTPEAEAEDTVEGGSEAPTASDKPAAKAKKESSRAPVPTGYTTPVAFAKELTKHLHETGELDAEKEIPPQVVYSYIKNSKGGKNPFPVYDGVEGRNNLLKLDENGRPTEGLTWWDEKNKRVAASKANAAAKAAKKAAKPDAPAEAEATQGEVEEAE